jgi:hypothetical protein
MGSEVVINGRFLTKLRVSVFTPRFGSHFLEVERCKNTSLIGPANICQKLLLTLV